MALAQGRPQLTWDGYVSGSAVLYIQGNRVDVQGRDTGAVDRPRYNFTEALPAVRQRVDVRTRQGRGRVAVVEQPEPANEYSAVVRIDAPNDRHEHYVLDLYWDAAGQYSDAQYGRNRRNDEWQTRGRTADRHSSGEMTWSGEVDDEALIEVRNRRAVVRTVRGREVIGDRASFSSPMPRNVEVRLEDAQGRGRIELVDQPTRDNGNTAVVRIVDPEGGSGRYSFRLSWNADGYANDPYSRSDDRYSRNGPYSRNEPYYDNSGRGGVLTPGGGGYGDYDSGAMSGGGNVLRWSGRVDGKVRVSVQGRRAWTTRVSGAPVYGEQVSFGSPLPRAEVRDVEIRKLQGREDVKVVQEPSSRNGYTLIFEVNDDDSGADDYVVEVTWR